MKGLGAYKAVWRVVGIAPGWASKNDSTEQDGRSDPWREQLLLSEVVPWGVRRHSDHIAPGTHKAENQPLGLLPLLPQKNPMHLPYVCVSRSDRNQKKHGPHFILAFQIPGVFPLWAQTPAVKESRKHAVFTILSEAFSKAYYKGVGMEFTEPICNTWHGRRKG